MRDSGALALEIAIVVWVTTVANAGIWWQLQDRLFDAIRRQRLGTTKGGFLLFLGMLGRPKSSGSMLKGHGWARFEALVKHSDDEEVERQRRLNLVAFGMVMGVGFVGILAIPYTIATLRDLFPGSLIAWSSATSLVAMAIWIVSWIRIRRMPTRPGMRRVATVAGVLVNAVSLAALAALWRTGGL